MAVVSVAIVFSFHLRSQPTSVERRVAFPFGLIFWFLSLACLANGLSNYMRTVRKYSKRRAIVQSGWKTEAVRQYRHELIMVSCGLLTIFSRYLSSLRWPLSRHASCFYPPMLQQQDEGTAHQRLKSIFSNSAPNR